MLMGQVMLASIAMALEINDLWDYGNPELSEQHFRSSLDGSTEDERLILQTQIARTYGMRGNFTRAREILSAVEKKQAAASPEVQARYFLELGRTYASAAHSETDRTPGNLATARKHFLHAYAVADRAGLDYLAIDALHMMSMVETDPGRQLAWDEKALEYMERSNQVETRQWEGSLRNNIGYAKHQMGEYEAALTQFQLSRSAYERAGKDRNARIADWMIAWTYRSQKRYTEALSIQLELERQWDEVGEPDPYVYEELVHIYRALGEEQRAEQYANKLINNGK